MACGFNLRTDVLHSHNDSKLGADKNLPYSACGQCRPTSVSVPVQYGNPKASISEQYDQSAHWLHHHILPAPNILSVEICRN